jgi:hypothetical protein
MTTEKKYPTVMVAFCEDKIEPPAGGAKALSCSGPEINEAAYERVCNALRAELKTWKW